ncbi:hypothetical protein NQ317_017344 [Molorchus minor]|uniref:Uncharacterized protein n=1 Tax=Molorchus minor TaxID=1323400 RepID=A0ABQ9JCF1_9CUCU|nr:hypothetical protein NQ317_017344 [Molorchus minor]
MSINVTVTGNPVSIRKGKMVTCDLNGGKKEFDKRRLMRLEQVRQQSKDIAEDVRNKVRKEKSKQMHEIEKEGKEKLRNWQNRKLLELQTQYKEALQELGVGHKQAVELEGEGEVLAEEILKRRKRKPRRNPVHHKRQKKRRRVSADINISIPASESDEKIDENFVASSEEEQIISHEITQDSEEPREPFGLNKSLGLECPYQEATAKDLQPTCPCTKTFGAAPIRSGKGLPTGAYQHTRTYKEPPDRIKRREIMASQPDYCDTAAEIQPTPFVESDTQIRDAINSRLFGKSPEPCNVCTCKRNQAFSPPSFDRDIRDGQYPDEDMSMKPKSVEDDIPTKTPNTLQSKDPKKVGYYDHPNRFSQEKLVVPPKASVEKIAADSLEVLPNVTSEAEWKQKIKQRDREARIRGQRALERERIHKDYDDMMKQLPLLLKKERIAKIGQDKPKYHMTEERLQELERERQNRLDNAYRKLFSKFKPKLVTLPVVQPPLKPGKKPPDYTPTTKAATWDVDCERKLYTTEEVQELIDRFTEQPHDRQERLNEFLKCLDSQKEQLLKELQSLPQDDSVDQLINDLTSVSDDSDAEERDKKTGTSERKRRREEQEKDSSAESNAGSLSSLKETEPIKEKKETWSQRPHSDRTKAPSPRKKAKLKGRKKVLILQNTSTQTTPKASSSSENKTDKIKRQHEQKTNQINRETQQVDKKTELVKDKMETFNQGTHQVKQRAEPVDKKTEQSDQKKNNQTSKKGNLLVANFMFPVIAIKKTKQPLKKPEVVVKSKEKENRISANDLKRSGPEATKVKSKSVAVGTDEYKPNLQLPKKKLNLKVKLNLKQVELKLEKALHLIQLVHSQNLNHGGNSSAKTRHLLQALPTFSPPDFRKVEELLISGSSDASKLSFYNLSKKPRQGNLNESTTAVSMSRSRIPIGEKKESIENLTVSTSSIQTPSQSIVEMESNNPMAQVHNIIKYLNLRAEDIAEALRYTPDPDPTSPRYNTSASSSDLSQIEENKQKEPKDVKKSTTSEKGTTNTSSGSKNSILLQYADVTDCCSKRIATLAAMINQIREDKIKLLSDSLGNAKVDDHSKRSDKDHSTAYLDLPDSRESSKHSTSTSLDDDELHRRLIEIDMSLAKKLRGLSPVQQKPRVTGAPASSKDDSSSVDKSYGTDFNG